MPSLRIRVRNGSGLETSQTVSIEVAREPPATPEASRQIHAGGRVRLGQILVESGVITQAELRRALEEQRRTGQRLGAIVRALGLGSQTSIAEALAQQLGLRFVRLDARNLNPAVLARIPVALVRRHQVVPIEERDGKLVLGMVDPLDVVAIDDVGRATGLPVDPAVIIEDDFQYALGQYPAGELNLDDQAAAGLEQMVQAIKPAGLPEESISDDPLAVSVDGAPVVRLVNLILVQAIRQRASDIHIEPQEMATRVRYRKDGMLSQALTAPPHAHAALVSRIKIMAGMNIAERRVPQDGRVELKVDGRDVRLRVSSIPTPHGEKVVIRILERAAAAVEIGKLGLRPIDAQRFEQLITRPHGIILFTGPTGSGKTTSLYAVLNRLNRESVNILTIEDPVEYQLPGINQVQVNPKAGLTFASGLRGFLRQDPDIIMVGEIRDEETARIALHAALTGHLVLSTLHTNDAPGAAVRLVDMGVEPFLVASALLGVVAQRLVRVLCERCREPIPLPDDLARTAASAEGEAPTVYRPRGCEFCEGTGYRGRVGLFEIMLVSPQIRDLIARNAPASELAQQAAADGMYTLYDDGLAKALAGVTSLEEVYRVANVEPTGREGGRPGLVQESPTAAIS
ncbi:MAG: ATPase, T2SS/T4P/T4SS family [Armatimonadota bacterium]|nr:ATPase, T2SS/T4P/T4SS family [Armatimonadota bacterium]